MAVWAHLRSGRLGAAAAISPFSPPSSLPEFSFPPVGTAWQEAAGQAHLALQGRVDGQAWNWASGEPGGTAPGAWSSSSETGPACGGPQGGHSVQVLQKGPVCLSAAASPSMRVARALLRKRPGHTAAAGPLFCR